MAMGIRESDWILQERATCLEKQGGAPTIRVHPVLRSPGAHARSCLAVARGGPTDVNFLLKLITRVDAGDT